MATTDNKGPGATSAPATETKTAESKAETKRTDVEWKAAGDRLLSLEKLALENSGKKGHNPHLWIAKNIAPLKRRFIGDNGDEPERSNNLWEAIAKLPAIPNTEVAKLRPLVTIPKAPSQEISRTE